MRRVPLNDGPVRKIGNLRREKGGSGCHKMPEWARVG